MTEEMLLLIAGFIIGLFAVIGFVVALLWVADWAHERKVTREREAAHLAKLDREMETRENQLWDFPAAKPRTDWDGTTTLDDRTERR